MHIFIRNYDRSADAGKTLSKLGFNHYVGSDVIGHSGGLIFAWTDNLSCSIIYASSNIINVMMHSLEGDYLVSFIYGPPSSSACNLFWAEVSSLTTQVSSAWMLELYSSDHCPLIVLMMYQKHGNVVKKGSFGFILTSKINAVVNNLKIWNQTEFGNILKLIKNTELELAKLQQNMSHDLNLSRERILQSESEKMLKMEEIPWAQKSRQIWLLNGERNTTYFNTVVKKRKINNRIVRIKNDSLWALDYRLY